MQSHWFHYMGEGGVAVVEWWAVMLAYLFAATPEFRENLFPRKFIITLPEPRQPVAPGARVGAWAWAGARGGGWAGPY